MSARVSVTFHSLFYFSDSLFLPAQIRGAVSFGIYVSSRVFVCCLTQAGWEKRVLKSLNSMTTELEVPLARMVAPILSLAHECTTSPRSCSLPTSVVTTLSCFKHETTDIAAVAF